MICSLLRATVSVFRNSMWVLFTWTITHKQSRANTHTLHYAGPLSRFTHPPLSSTFRGLSWGSEVVEHLLLLYCAPPIVQLHINCSTHVRSQIGFSYSTSHQFIQTLAEEAFFCVSIMNRIKAEKCDSHIQTVNSCSVQSGGSWTSSVKTKM